MRHRLPTILLAGVVLASNALTLSGQTYRGKKTQSNGRATRRTGTRDRGTVNGSIVRIRRFNSARGKRGDDAPRGGAGKKIGSIAIRIDGGAQFSAVLTGATDYSVQNTVMTRSKVMSLLVPGVPVELNWKTSDEVGGRAVTDLRIRTIEIEGVIKTANRRKLVVMASPRVRSEATPIRVRGRAPEQPRKPRRKLKPRKLSLRLAEVTQFTLNGKESSVETIRATMEFNAIVTNGSPGVVLELHLRGEDDKNGDRGDNKVRRSRGKVKKNRGRRF